MVRLRTVDAVARIAGSRHCFVGMVASEERTAPIRASSVATRQDFVSIDCEKVRNDEAFSESAWGAGGQSRLCLPAPRAHRPSISPSGWR